MKINKIYLDMDGVLVDLVESAVKVLSITEQDVFANPNILDEMGVWDMLGSNIDWWENLLPYEWKDDLINACENIATTYILTAPSKTATGSVTGKLLWIREHCPKMFKESRFIITNQKHLLANSSSLLIDDTSRKVEKFIINGGSAILFPQMYNTKEGNRPFNTARELIGYLQNECSG